MQKIVPSLWFDKEAVEAATFYTSIFDNSKTNWQVVLKDTPGGDSEQISFTLDGIDIYAISAGPIFQLNPSISLSVYCKTVEEVEELWAKLVEGGSVLMELDTYSFSKRYGWLNDRFGVSWQIMHVEDPFEQKIYPSMLFVGDQFGKTEEAVDFYLSVFKNSSKDEFYRYGEYGEEGTYSDPNAVMFTTFTLEGLTFTANDSDLEHKFDFNEAFSLMVYCDTQEEIDYYWEKMSAVPEAEQCGWLKDKFGVSWQIVPREMDDMLRADDETARQRVVGAFLPMKKLDIQALRDAYEGK